MENGKKNKKNFLLDPIKKRLLRKDNVAPAAKFIQRKTKMNEILKKFNEGTGY